MALASPGMFWGLILSIEAIGILALGIGLLSLAFGPSFSIYAIMIGTLLGAAAATILNAVGGASVPPVQVAMLFAVIGVLMNSRQSVIAFQAFKFPTRGFWLATTVIYGLISSFFLPRLFLGQTKVFAIDRTAIAGAPIALIPLAPVSGNLTQPVYFLIDAICFSLFYFYGSNRQTFDTIINAILVTSIVNIAFGIIDFITYKTGTDFLMMPIRNGTYSLLIGATLAGFKRIVGSFTEAGNYGSTSLWFMAFSAKLCLRGIKSRFTFISALGSFVAIIASTSTAAYVGLGCILTVEYVIIIARLIIGKVFKSEIVFVILLPLLVGLFITLLALDQSVWSTLQDVIQLVFYGKASSESGVERAAWNQQGITNLIETWGFGVGLGSTRTSSWIIAVPASIGVFGTIIYFVFIGLVLLPRRIADTYLDGVQSASRSACLAVLIFACASGSFGLGLQFLITAALTAIPLQTVAAFPNHRNTA